MQCSPSGELDGCAEFSFRLPHNGMISALKGHCSELGICNSYFENSSCIIALGFINKNEIEHNTGNRQMYLGILIFMDPNSY